MKKNLIIALMAILALASCNNNSFTINGTVSGFDGQYVTLSYQPGTPQDSTRIDSALVENGKFTFTGELETPVAMAQLMLGDPMDRENFRGALVFIEPTEITVELGNTPQEFKVTGSKTQEEYDRVQAATDSIMKDAQPILDAMEKESDPIRHAALMDSLAPFQEKVKHYNIDYVKQHPASFVSPYVLLFITGDLEYADYKAIVEGFSPEIKKYCNLSDFNKELEALGNVQPGAEAPDFETTDINGQPFKLSSLKGHVVILDFWASWCVPCRQSMPHVKALYEQYKDKGLEVVCISDDDSNPDAWHKAVETDGTELFHHVLRGRKFDPQNPRDGGPNDISEKYAIHYLPTKYLVDTEGKVIDKVVDETLEAKLKEIYQD